MGCPRTTAITIVFALSVRARGILYWAEASLTNHCIPLTRAATPQAALHEVVISTPVGIFKGYVRVTVCFGGSVITKYRLASLCAFDPVRKLTQPAAATPQHCLCRHVHLRPACDSHRHTVPADGVQDVGQRGSVVLASHRATNWDHPVRQGVPACSGRDGVALNRLVGLTYTYTNIDTNVCGLSSGLVAV